MTLAPEELFPPKNPFHTIPSLFTRTIRRPGWAGCCPTYGARRLRRKGRERPRPVSGVDPTDYTTSPTARSFVPFYAQRLSSACVLSGAGAIQKSLKRMADRRSSATTAA